MFEGRQKANGQGMVDKGCDSWNQYRYFSELKQDQESKISSKTVVVFPFWDLVNRYQ